MCGIVAYTGSQFALPIILESLSKLEYRGYDSAGIAFVYQDKLIVEKRQGRLNCLAEAMKEQGWLDPAAKSDVWCGIGHTRWATHGAPSDLNAHPHLSAGARLAIVHNGIIENEKDLRLFLIQQGFCFKSETDSEVIAHLIEYHNSQQSAPNDWREAVRLTVADLQGSYALGIIVADDPDQIIVARKDSPLVIGLGEGWHMAASDIPALLGLTRQVMILNDGDIACISSDCCSVFDSLGQSVQRPISQIEWDSEAAEKGGYEHFMIKEIHEEPRAVRQTLSPRYKDQSINIRELEALPALLQKISQIMIVACGTAYHAGMVGQRLIEQCCRRHVAVSYASEFRYSDPLIDEKTLVIIISQSGETLDTIAALREAQKRGSVTLAIVNVMGSTIAREADHVFYTYAGPEIAVASTKAYSTQLSALYMLTFYMARIWGSLSQEQLADYEKKLLLIPELISQVLQEKDQIQRFAAAHFNAHSVFFMGRQLDYALAMEASLKLKEISYIHSEAYAGGELKHGTIALIEDGTLVICPLTQPLLLDKMISNIREVKTRGAFVVGIISRACLRASEICDVVIEIPEVEPLLAPLLAVVPAQLIAYYFSVLKGLDVDKPRNLAKSVTVE